MTIAVGTVIRGKYRVDKVLGQGGMGVVVGALHLALEQPVAIKFLLPAMLEHPAIVERFAREARAASKIQSDNVARVMDVDALDDGTPFMVMEYLEGHDLSIVRKTGRVLAPHVGVGYILEACEAVGEAHRVGIIHRDLKPANLFLSRRADGRMRIKVLDFGISKLGSGEGEISVTTTSTVVGSAEYMSPEQMFSARDADARSDIWALGVTLYEILTGAVPFKGDTITQVCALVLQTQPAPPSLVARDLPPELDAVVLRCLDKDKAKRFQNVSELMAALAPFAQPYQAPAPPPPTARLDAARGTVRVHPGVIQDAGWAGYPAPATGRPPMNSSATTVLPEHAGSSSPGFGSDPAFQRGSIPPTHGSPPSPFAGPPMQGPPMQSASMQGPMQGAPMPNPFGQPAAHQSSPNQGVPYGASPSGAAPPSSSGSVSSAGTQSSFSASQSHAIAPRSRAPVFILASVGIVAVLGIGAVIATRGTDKPTPASHPMTETTTPARSTESATAAAVTRPQAAASQANPPSSAPSAVAASTPSSTVVAPPPTQPLTIGAPPANPPPATVKPPPGRPKHTID